MRRMRIADDLRTRDALVDPHSFFRRLREHDPLHWSEPCRAWIATGHAEVCEAFRDTRRLSSDRLSALEARLAHQQGDRMSQTFQLLRGWMVFNDPPEHTRLRDPLSKVLTPRQVNGLAGRIRAIVDELLDAMQGRDRVELVEAFAFPLPAIVIAELLGVPPEDREKFKTWAAKLGALVFGAVELPDREEIAREGAAEFTEYFDAMVRRYERAPGNNLISHLIAARDRGEGLAPEALAGACTLLLFGGHETTTGLIANGVSVLLDHPRELARLQADPGLAPRAVEELLRFEGPAKVMVRQVVETHERGAHKLEAGERVYLSLAGANRDPAVFPDPDRLDLTRHPNPHTSFGHGLHFCLGANLARREVQIALNALLARFPKLRFAEPPEWGGSIIGRGVNGVHLELG